MRPSKRRSDSLECRSHRHLAPRLPANPENRYHPRQFEVHSGNPDSKVTATSLAEARKQGAVLAWGSFLTVVINFIIIAWVLFLVVKLMNQMMQSEAPRAPALTKQEMLLTEIRDLLKREQR